MLPAGVIVLKTDVTDIYLTLASAMTNVGVTPAPAPDLSHILNTSLTNAFAVGNINLAIQTVNNVSMQLLFRLILSTFMKYLIIYLFYCKCNLFSIDCHNLKRSVNLDQCSSLGER